VIRRTPLEFPYGRAPLGILVLAAVAGVVLLASGGAKHQEKFDLIFVTFTKEHAAAYQVALPAFEAANNCRVQIQVVDDRALQSRLQSAMQVGADVPDMVELQDGFMSFYTKGRLEDVQFVDLTDRIKSSGLYEKLVQNRFSKWQSRGRIFALPHDVHPTVLTYRKDIVAQLGIDVSKLTTWDEFTRVGRELVSKQRAADGTVEHYMIDLPTDGTNILPLLALQRGAAMFDEAGNVRLDDEAFVDVICWYVRQIQGKDRISFPCGYGQNLSKAMIDGLALFYCTPDWRTMQFEFDIPSLKGKMGVMPMPAWEEGGRRTSTWGATGLAFPRRGRNFELAWKLAMHLYYDPPQLGPRFAQTNILPPLKDAWTQPEFHATSEFWGCSLGEAFIPLADDVPAAPSNAYHYTAISKLSQAFTKASNHYANYGETGLREVARRELKRSADEVRTAIRRNVFLRGETATGDAEHEATGTEVTP
jgi:arabinosaccharide transport system substrate-binding protein